MNAGKLCVSNKDKERDKWLTREHGDRHSSLTLSLHSLGTGESILSSQVSVPVPQAPALGT